MNLKLTYFNAPGRAEPVRIALTLAGLPFEDNRVDFQGFMAVKPNLPLCQVPVLEVDGVTLPQTGAMLRFAARAGAPDLYPSDPVAAFHVDAVLDSFNDTLSHAMAPSLFERDMEKKLAMRKELVAGPMKLVYSFTEGVLERSGGPFVAGEKMSIADLVVAAQVLQIRSGNFDGVSEADLEPYPRIRALATAYLADPRIQAYQGQKA